MSSNKFNTPDLVNFFANFQPNLSLKHLYLVQYIMKFKCPIPKFKLAFSQYHKTYLKAIAGVLFILY